MIQWVEDTQTVNGVQWVQEGVLGAVKDPAACNAMKQQLSLLTAGMPQIAKDLADANTQVIQAKESGDPNAIAAAEAYLKAAQAGFSSNQNQIAALTQQMKSACAEVSGGQPSPCANCKADEECFNDKCVKKCPTNYIRAADGTCKLPEPSTGGVSDSSNWGLVLLAAGAAVAVFFGLRGLKNIGPQENREAA